MGSNPKTPVKTCFKMALIYKFTPYHDARGLFAILGWWLNFFNMFSAMIWLEFGGFFIFWGFRKFRVSFFSIRSVVNIILSIFEYVLWFIIVFSAWFSRLCFCKKRMVHVWLCNKDVIKKYYSSSVIFPTFFYTFFILWKFIYIFHFYFVHMKWK